MAVIINSASDEQIAKLDAYQAFQLYNAIDCCVTAEIFTKRQMDRCAEMTYLNAKDKQAMCLEMQLRGIKVNEAAAYEEVQTLTREINNLTKYFDDICLAIVDRTVNVNSPQQLLNLFREFGFKISSTDRDTLEKLMIEFYAEPIVRVILAIRDKVKLRNVISKSKRSRTGRFHASFKVAGTSTGRLSSSKDPFGEGHNLQNITDRTRRVFIADPDKKLAYIDLEQAESRAVAYLSQDESYIKACESGDLHTLVCQMVWEDLPWTGELSADKAIAETPFYRWFTYRDMAKRGGHGCLTTDHEVLTPDGWVPIADVPDGTPILAWNQYTKKVQWEIPSHWERKPWHGALYEIEGRSYSMKATSDHRIPLQGRSGAIKECPAENLKIYSNYNLPLQGKYVGGAANVTETQARLCAAAQADGHVYKNGSVRWGFSRNRKKERLEWLLEAYRPHITEYKTRNEIYYHLSADQVDFPVRKQAGAWMLEWPLSALQAWVDELKFWDGTIQDRFTWIYSKNREHAWWMYFFCRMVGQGASYCPNVGHDCARVGLNARSGARIDNMKITKTDGNGTMVSCPTVSSSGFVVRRNGHVMFSLNTNYYGKPFTMAKHLKIAKSVMEDFQNRYFAAFPGIRKGHYRVMKDLMTDGWLMTPFGRKRGFFGRHNDDSTIRKAIAFEPQSLVGDIINEGIDRVRDIPGVEILAQVHDAVLFQYPADQEATIIPDACTRLQVPVQVFDKTLTIPVEPKVGWNWGQYDPHTNPHGIKKWTGQDDRLEPKYDDFALLDTTMA